MFCSLDVAPGPAGSGSLLVERELPPDVGRRAKDERAGRNAHPESDERVRADDGARADFGAVENDRAHANKDFIVDLAGVNDSAVANGDKLAYTGRITGIDMDDGIVLDIGTWSDDDAVNVAAQDGAGPDARFRLILLVGGVLFFLGTVLFVQTLFVAPQMQVPFALRQLKGQLKALQKENPAGQVAPSSLLWQKFGAARQAAKKLGGPAQSSLARPRKKSPDNEVRLPFFTHRQPFQYASLGPTASPNYPPCPGG